MRLSDNFSLEEFTISQTAVRKGIKNKPSKKAIANLKALCEHILQPIRYNYGPVVISSGYRCTQLNKSIGGSIHSQHCKGEAADFTCPRYDNKEVARFIRGMLMFDQLILEYYPGGWIHVSYKDKGRGSVLRAVKKGKKTEYLEGLE